MARQFAIGDGGGDTELWARRRSTALLVVAAAQSLKLRSGSDTVLGALDLINALDLYWQARYGGRVVTVAPESGR